MLLRGARVYLEDEFKAGPEVRTRDGLITEVGENLIPEGGEKVLDLNGDYLIPGFVDVHIHAFRGYDTMRGEEDIRRMAEELGREGTAAFCPTTMSAGIADTAAVIGAVRRVRMKPGKGAKILGAHMEAPFLSGKHAGAQRAECFLDPDWDIFLQLTGGHPEEVRMITLAPEKKGAEAFIRRAAESGITVSAGHSDATAEQLHRAADLGLTHATHLFNAQSALHHRAPGIPGAALTDGRIYTEMICDGVHLHRDTVRLVWTAKGPDRTPAITDAMEAAGMPEGEYTLGGQRVFVRNGEARLADGTLAGSVLIMRRALENLIHLFNIPPRDAVRMCTVTPAESIGEKVCGRIMPGAPAVMTRWSGDWRYLETL